MSLPDYSVQRRFYGLLDDIRANMLEREEKLQVVKDSVGTLRNGDYAVLYAQLPADQKAYLESILEM